MGRSVRRRRRVASAAVSAVLALALCGCTPTIGGTGHPAAGAGRTPSGGASVPPGPASSSARAGSGRSPGSGPVAATTVVAADGTRYPIKVWAQRQVSDCAAHAYGRPVISFLQRHPCDQLRQVLATTTVVGRVVGFAQRAIVFAGSPDRGEATARQFEDVVSRAGTGNLNDLLREGLRMPGTRRVPFPNAFSALQQDAGVTVVEAWYIDGPTPNNDPALVKMARDIFQRL